MSLERSLESIGLIDEQPWTDEDQEECSGHGSGEGLFR